MFRPEINRLSLFAELTPAQTERIEPMLESARFRAGQTLFQQGQPADYLYMLESGVVRVEHKPFDGPTLTVARIQPGGIFGWSAALKRPEYTSGAVAEQDGLAVCMRAEMLGRLCQADPELGCLLLGRLAEAIAERLCSTYNEILGILCTGMVSNSIPIRRTASYEQPNR
jgi:CRP-like cAMP-binding protein